MKSIVDTNIVKALGLNHLSDKDQEKLLLNISDVIYDSIVSRAIHAMDARDKAELQHMLADNPSFDNIGAFIYEKVPNIDRIAEEEIISFKKTALDTVHAVLAA